MPMLRPWILCAILSVCALSACSDDAETLDTCNGHEELCDRRFNAVAFPTTHNSMSNSDDKWFIPNQTHGLEQQLEDGVRGFLLDVHPQGDTLYLCHTECDFGKRPFDESMHVFREFLETNRREVITFILEDHVDAARIVTALEDVGLDKWAYDGYDNEQWPTLRALIDDDTRLIVTAENSGGEEDTPAWYVNAWDVMFDNPYSNKTVDDFSCALNRGETSHDLYLVNHWLSDPVSLPELADVANTTDVLLDHMTECETMHGRIPNFVAVDHYSIGDLFDVVRTLNGLDDPAP